MKERDFLTLGVVGVLAYVLYQKFGNVLDTSVAAPIANWWVNMASPPIVPNGSIYFQDGSYVSFANINTYWDPTNTKLLINYNGHVYQLAPHDSNGNYPATLVS